MIQKFVNRIRAFSFLKSAGLYALTNFINSALPFLLLPLITKYLTPDSYGIVAMFQFTITLAGPFVGCNVEGGIAPTYFQSSRAELEEYLSACCIIVCISFAICALLVVIFSDVITAIVHLKLPWLMTILCTALFQIVFNYRQTLWQVQSEAKKYCMLSFFSSLTLAGSVIFLVAVLKLDWQGRILAQIVPSTIVAVISIISLRREFPWRRPSLLLIKKALRFGIPLFPHAVGSWALLMVDRAVLSSMSSLYVTGLYSFAQQIVTPMRLIEGSVNTAYVPWLYARLNEGCQKTKNMIVRYTYFYMVGLFAVALIMSIFVEGMINIIVDHRYWQAKPYVHILLFARAIDGMYFMTTNYIIYSMKTYYLSLSTIIAGVFQLLMSILLIKNFGEIGVAYASFCSSVIWVGLTWYFSNVAYKMPWFYELKRIISRTDTDVC